MRCGVSQDVRAAAQKSCEAAVPVAYAARRSASENLDDAPHRLRRSSYSTDCISNLYGLLLVQFGITLIFMKVLRKVLMLVLSLVWIKACVSPGGSGDWRTASRESAGIAPDPAELKEAVVQVYAARAFSWRGILGVHTWISVKPTDGVEFTVYEVIGWRAYRGQSVVSISNRPPDGRWFGATPQLLLDLRGPGVDAVIARIDTVAKNYPYPHQYRVWPGPNSNTFTAYVARSIPQLRLDLPPTAIGKDYLTDNALIAETPSSTGYQFSLFGVLGVLVGVEEGLEFNVLGLTFGIDPADFALKLPAIGRVGP